tara:strand:- start:169 stop:510 length:342 start_codon:yes stop_codon:yes gene_type:complete
MTQIIENKMREDISLGRYAFLDKYGNDMESFYDMVTAEHIRDIVKTSLLDIQKWKQKESLMGQVSDWLIEMEEDAGYLTEQQWIAKHGFQRKEIWDKARKEIDGQLEMDISNE